MGLSLCAPGLRWVLSQECVGAKSRLMLERCSQVSQGLGAVMGNPLEFGHTPSPPSERARRATGPLRDCPCSLSWLPALWSPTRSLPSAAPVPPTQAPQAGTRVEGQELAQTASALIEGSISASPLRVIFPPCLEPVPRSPPFILLAQVPAWEAYRGPSLPCSCQCSLRARILPLRSLSSAYGATSSLHVTANRHYPPARVPT